MSLVNCGRTSIGNLPYISFRGKILLATTRVKRSRASTILFISPVSPARVHVQLNPAAVDRKCCEHETENEKFQLSSSKQSSGGWCWWEKRNTGSDENRFQQMSKNFTHTQKKKVSPGMWEKTHCMILSALTRRSYFFFCVFPSLIWSLSSLISSHSHMGFSLSPLVMLKFHKPHAGQFLFNPALICSFISPPAVVKHPLPWFSICNVAFYLFSSFRFCCFYYLADFKVAPVDFPHWEIRQAQYE